MRLVTLLPCLLLLGCAKLFPPGDLPPTPGERYSGYVYIPIDPFSIETEYNDETCNFVDPNDPGTRLPIPEYVLSNTGVLAALPDNAVRVSIQSYNASGKFSYGPVSVGARGESYRVTVDYINADTVDFPVGIRAYVRSSDSGNTETFSVNGSIPEGFDRQSAVYEVTSDITAETDPGWEEYHIPVYVGIGLRATANVFVRGASANIAGLGVIGLEAEAGAISGDLVVQTLGVNGPAVSAALPIQSELNRTTAQSAVTSIATIKALLYDDETEILQRVVGLYLPFRGDVALVNAIISELSKNPPVWNRICKFKKEEAQNAVQ